MRVVEAGDHDPKNWSGMESHYVRCGNDPDDSKLSSTIKVADGFGIRTSDLLGVTNAWSTWQPVYIVGWVFRNWSSVNLVKFSILKLYGVVSLNIGDK